MSTWTYGYMVAWVAGGVMLAANWLLGPGAASSADGLPSQASPHGETERPVGPGQPRAALGLHGSAIITLCALDLISVGGVGLMLEATGTLHGQLALTVALGAPIPVILLWLVARRRTAARAR